MEFPAVLRVFQVYKVLQTQKIRVPQKEVGKRSSVAFFVFGTLLVTFWSLF